MPLVVPSCTFDGLWIGMLANMADGCNAPKPKSTKQDSYSNSGIPIGIVKKENNKTRKNLLVSLNNSGNINREEKPIAEVPILMSNQCDMPRCTSQAPNRFPKMFTVTATAASAAAKFRLNPRSSIANVGNQTMTAIH